MKCSAKCTAGDTPKGWKPAFEKFFSSAEKGRKDKFGEHQNF